jgi:hypothetical protein
VPEVDDGVRGKHGVVASLRLLPDNRVRVVFDDAVAVAGTSATPQQWAPSRLYTWAHFDASKFKAMEFTDKELADLGFNLLARLSVLAAADA